MTPKADGKHVPPNPERSSMQLIKPLTLIGCLTLFTLNGCGNSTQPEAVAAADEIEQFLADNPEMAIDQEEEAALMAGDDAEEGQ